MSDQPVEPQLPFPRPNPLEAPPAYGELRRQGPVVAVRLATGHSAFLVTGYDEVQVVLQDPRFSLAAVFADGAPDITPIRQPPGSLLSLDPPEHDRLRSTVAGAFGHRRMATLRGRVVEIVDDLLAAMESQGPPVDLVAALAAPLPVTVICDLLGVPEGDRARFRGWTSSILSTNARTPEELQQAYGGIVGYFYSLVAAKQVQPGDDLLSDLISFAGGRNELTVPQIVTMGVTILLAGYETSVAFLARSAVRLLGEPRHYSALRDGPESLSSLVEESLRLSAHGPALPRIATESVDLGAVRIPAGSPVVPAIDAANRDPRRFAEPDTLNPARPRQAHLTFGHGPHFCLGAPLARLEMQVTLSRLADRFPHLRMSLQASELNWGETLAGGPRELPVSW
ncbi:MAG: monooxygenase [Marmoricola sp.]|nr:monooxygenase [Marmoricola sp.]